MLIKFIFSVIFNLFLISVYFNSSFIKEILNKIKGSRYFSFFSVLLTLNGDPLVKKLKTYGELASFLDACVLCLDAGLSLPLAFAEAASKIQVDQIRLLVQRVLRHYNLGSTFGQALENGKTGHTSFIFNDVLDTLLVSIRLGSDISRSLDALASQFRSQAKAGVEEMAARAPIKMLFPLILFILPVIFILLGSGTIEQLIQSFSKI